MTDFAAPVETARRGRTRERLLDAAYEVFAESGVHTASVEQISERAGFTRGAFYSNFSTKEELFFALMERENDLRMRCLVDQVGLTVPKLGDATLTADSLGGVILEFLRGPLTDDRRWCIIQAEFELLAMRDSGIARQYRDFHVRFNASLAGVVGGALGQAGRGFSFEPIVAVRLIVSAFDDAVKQSILEAESEPDALERLRTTLTSVVIAVSTAQE